MPQMAPLLWTPLGVSIMISLIFVMTVTYFFTKPMLNFYKPSSTELNKYFWKW